MEGFRGSTWNAQAALFEQELDQDRTSKSASRMLNPLHPFRGGQVKQLLKISFGPTPLTGLGDRQPLQERREKKEESAKGRCPGSPLGLKGIKLSPAVRTAAQEMLGCDLLQKTSRKLTLLDSAQNLAREVDVIHQQCPHEDAEQIARKHNKKAYRRHLSEREVARRHES
jgi:hypothetical protein